MGKRFGVKELPGLILFRRGRHIKYEDDLEDEEESETEMNFVDYQNGFWHVLILCLVF